MHLHALTEPDLVFPNLSGLDGSSVLRTLAAQLAAAREHFDTEELFSRLWQREQLGSTGIGSGVAVPHCKIAGLTKVVLAVGLVTPAIEFGAIDHRPVSLFFLVVSPEDQPAAHLQCLAAISKWVSGVEGKVDDIAKLTDAAAIYQALAQTES